MSILGLDRLQMSAFEIDDFNPETASEQLIAWMSRWSELRRMGQMKHTPETADELLERCGRLMVARLALPKRLVFPASKQCYLNAFNLFNRRDGLHYCEGNVFMAGCPIPVLHGWCVNGDGLVLDPSIEFERGAVYYGIEYEDDFTRERWKQLRRKAAIGILPNVWMLREKDNRWLEAGIRSTNERSVHCADIGRF